MTTSEDGQQGLGVRRQAVPGEQARIVRLLVERIDLSPDGMQVGCGPTGCRRWSRSLRSRRRKRHERRNGTMAGENWEFDGKTITVRIPMTWKRRGGRKVIIAPDGGDAWAPAKPRPDETLIRALARAHRWKRIAGGREVPVSGRNRGRREGDAEFREPATAAHSARAGYSGSDPRRAAAEGDDARTVDGANVERVG